MMTTAFLDAPQIDELPEFWTAEECELFMEIEEDYAWDDDQALEEYSLECCFGPND